MTYSILAREPADGAIGAAVATAGPCVGGFVLHGLPAVGFVVTQGFSTNTLYGERGLQLLAQGRAAGAVCRALVGADSGRQRRQVAVMARAGDSAAWSGNDNDGWCGHRTHQDLALAGNRLASAQVLEAMWRAFEQASAASLATRLANALAAGREAGGDRHGTRSAALRILSPASPPIDLRVDLDPHPIERLSTLLAALQDPDYQAFLARIPRLDDPERA